MKFIFAFIFQKILKMRGLSQRNLFFRPSALLFAVFCLFTRTIYFSLDWSSFLSPSPFPLFCISLLETCQIHFNGRTTSLNPQSYLSTLH